MTDFTKWIFTKWFHQGAFTQYLSLQHIIVTNIIVAMKINKKDIFEFKRKGDGVIGSRWSR